MKKIVVPVDYSADSAKALEKAVLIAKRAQGELFVLHVAKNKNNIPQEQEFKEFSKNIFPYGTKYSYVTRHGKVSREIVNYCDEVNGTLIVMGTHGVSGFEEFWMGSNAYKVVTHASCPVLTLRESDGKRDIRKIILPIDTTISTRQKVPFTCDLAKAFNAEIHVLSICIDESQEFVTKLTNYSAQVVRFLSQKGVRSITEFVTGDNPTNMTLDYAKKIDADLISIMTEQEDSVMSFFLGAYAQQMVNHSPIPVLSMHKNPALEGNVAII